ncbi:hypothetical protein PAHAL_7G165100 [Panicum hallii]|uniref:BRE1-like coiled-coil containing domain-containing protein n=1 Tax=Panicum hallii TaxID=206008 RepID=A0A2S3I836_9POAL|nr:kinetochore protein SPC24 homolog [Panicum hallii]PAN38948.2 hypothetical protein PAHAL_7G165100 [Panicum hallii]
MAVDTGERLAVDEVLSFAQDLVGVLRASNDRDANAQTGAGARMLLSACRSDSDDLELQMREHQEKIHSCKEKIDKAKSETITDDELNALQKKMEEKLQEEKQLRQELRVLRDELDNLDRQRTSIEERKDAVKKKKKDMQKAERTLSMCVSVTNIMPNFEDQEKISGYIVDKTGKKIEKFEFEKTTLPVEICDKLWKKI